MERASGVKLRGKSVAPAFYESSKSVRLRSDSRKDALGRITDSGPLLIGAVVFGAGLLLYMRAKDRTYTQPILTLLPSDTANQSTIANELNAVAAIQHMVDLRNPATTV
jgi:hypothetical protein